MVRAHSSGKFLSAHKMSVAVFVTASFLAALPQLGIASEKSVLAVIDIEDRSGKFKSADIATATDILRGLIVSTGIFAVVDKGRQENKRKGVVRDLKRDSYAPCYDAQCQVELGRALSADSLLSCAIGSLGNTCSLNCELVPLDKEVAEKGGVATFKCAPENLVSALESVSAQITGISVQTSTSAPVERVSPPVERTVIAVVRPQPEDQPTPVTGDLDPSAEPKEDDGPWFYELDDVDREELQRAGCTFDKEDRTVANRMERRGFSVDQYIRAYQELYRLQGDKVDVEAIAVFQVTGMPLTHFRAYKNYGGTITQYYNRRVMGGRGKKIAGWVVLGIGMGAAALGALVKGLGSATKSAYDGGTNVVDIMGYTYLGIGGTLGLIGLPLVISGTRQTRKWLPSESLETEGVRQLRQLKLDVSLDQPTSTPTYLVHPFTVPQGGGLSLSVGF